MTSGSKSLNAATTTPGDTGRMTSKSLDDLFQAAKAIQALPYLMTVILLAGVIGTAIPPRASGVPYVKER